MPDLLSLVNSHRPAEVDAIIRIGHAAAVGKEAAWLKTTFTRTEFMVAVERTVAPALISPSIVSLIFDRLINWALILVHPTTGSFFEPVFGWDVGKLREYAAIGAFENIILGPASLLQKYEDIVPAVIAKKGESVHLGTAFLASRAPRTKDVVLITARHNVEDGGKCILEEVRIPACTSPPRELSEWYLHPTQDIAAVRVELSRVRPVFSPTNYHPVLTRVFTLGYPRVPNSLSTPLLIHSGEINTIVPTFTVGERIIISNAVAPGSSGGPVLNEAGHCVGMVTNSLESHHEGGFSSMNAAIPAKVIIDTINEVLGKG